jgi:hypothetical protein
MKSVPGLRRFALAVMLALVCLPAAALPDPVRFGNAMEVGDLRSARQWLDEGLPPDFEGERIGSGLMIAAWEGNIRLMALFVERGADVDHVSRFGEQALQLAAWRGHLEAVRWLLDRGAKVNRDGKQWSALHYAAFAGHADIAKLLIERGADLNARTPNDSTALMMTAREGHEAVARQLVEAGADTRPKNDWGDSALTWAMRYRHLGIAKIVVPPVEFAAAVQAPPETFGAPSRSEPPPLQLAEMLQELQRPQAEGRPTEALRKAFFDALASFREGAKPPPAAASRIPGLQLRQGMPKALVITASRREPGRERAELIYPQAPAAAPQPLTLDLPQILEQLRIAQAQGKPVGELRRALMEAVARFKGSEAPAK